MRCYGISSLNSDSSYGEYVLVISVAKKETEASILEFSGIDPVEYCV